MKILFVSDTNYKSGSFIYRIVSPIDGLIRNSHSIRYANNINLLKGQLKIFKPDLMVCYKFLFNSFFEEILQLTKQYNIPLYYDIDDLSYDDSIIEQSRIFNFVKSEINSGTAQNMQLYKNALLECDGVIVSTAGLFDEIIKIHKNVYLVNNYFPDSYLEYMKFKPVMPNKKRIIYTGSSILHGMFLEEIHDVLYYMLNQNKHENFELVVCGGIRLPPLFNKYADQIKYMEYSNIYNYFTTLTESSLVIAPIFNDRFSICKSWIKGLEPEIAGIPWISSPHPEYIKLCQHAESGMIAHDFYDWLEKIRIVLDNDNTVRLCNEHFLSSNNVCLQYDAVYRNALGLND